MKALGVGVIWSLLLLALAQVQYVGLISGSFQYNIASPENTIYDVTTVPLNISIRTTNGFRFGYHNYVNEIFYCLNGKGNVTVPFELTITGEEHITIIKL
jgi:oxalate decarboxylase/phosphoglucose isomerase-like protein (cupin superfamily)